jgi:hypothetical protein
MPRIKLNKFRLKARSKVATRDGPGIDSPQYGNGEESWVNEFLTEMDSASPSRTGKRPPELSAEEKRVARDVVSFQGLPTRPNLRVENVVLMPRIKLNIFRLNAQLEVVRRDGPGKDNPRDGPGKDNPQYGHGEGSWINEFLADMEDSP